MRKWRRESAGWLPEASRQPDGSIVRRNRQGGTVRFIPSPSVEALAEALEIPGEAPDIGFAAGAVPLRCMHKVLDGKGHLLSGQPGRTRFSTRAVALQRKKTARDMGPAYGEIASADSEPGRTSREPHDGSPTAYRTEPLAVSGRENPIESTYLNGKLTAFLPNHQPKLTLCRPLRGPARQISHAGPVFIGERIGRTCRKLPETQPHFATLRYRRTDPPSFHRSKISDRQVRYRPQTLFLNET